MPLNSKDIIYLFKRRQAGQSSRHTFQSPACLLRVSGPSDLQLVASPVCRQSVALSSPYWGNPPTWIKSAVLKSGWGVRPMLKKRSQFWTLMSRSFRAVTFQEGRGGLSTVWFPHFYEFVWKTFSPFWAHKFQNCSEMVLHFLLLTLNSYHFLHNYLRGVKNFQRWLCSSFSWLLTHTIFSIMISEVSKFFRDGFAPPPLASSCHCLPEASSAWLWRGVMEKSWFQDCSRCQEIYEN